MLTATPIIPPSTPVIPPVFHALTLASRLPEDVVVKIANGRPEKVSCSKWYKSRNRNGELVFTNNRILAFLWPSSNLYRAQLKGDFTEQEARKETAITFSAAGIPVDRANELAEVLEFDSEHKVYQVGLVSPFEIRDYKDSLGLTIRADKSHSGTIETESKSPSWARSMIHVLHIFSHDIELHLEVLRRISDAFTSDTETRRKVLTSQEQLISTIEKLLRKESVITRIMRLFKRLFSRVCL